MGRLRSDLTYGNGRERRGLSGSVLAAAECTLAIFLLLPLSEMLATPAGRSQEIRAIDTVHLLEPPPEVRRLTPPVPPQEKERKEERKLKITLEVPLESADERPALDLPVSFRLASPEFAGDFGLDFSVAPGGSAGPAPLEVGPRVFSISEVDRPPRPILRNEPIYPYRALRRSLEGRVTLELTVNTNGRVEDVRVLDAVRGEMFAEAAVKAARGWRFEPGVKDGEPVAVRLETTIHFQMENER